MDWLLVGLTCEYLQGRSRKSKANTKTELDAELQTGVSSSINIIDECFNVSSEISMHDTFLGKRKFLMEGILI